MGDGIWNIKKIILGWIIDTVQRTIKVPAQHVAQLHTIVAFASPIMKVIAIKQWHKILGELQSMSIVIQGTLGLISLLQETFWHVESS